MVTEVTGKKKTTN